MLQDEADTKRNLQQYRHCMQSTMDVFWSSQETIFRRQTHLLRCGICSNLSMTSRWYGSHTMAPYSKTACTRAMYAVRLLLMGHLRIFLLRKASVLFAFFGYCRNV